MEPNHAASVSGRIVAEFQDDASQFLSGEPEFVPSLAPSAPMNSVALKAWSLAPCFYEIAALAKKAWMRVISRFTEPVQGDGSRVRVRVNTESESGKVCVECRGGCEGCPHGRSFTGREL